MLCPQFLYLTKLVLLLEDKALDDRDTLEKHGIKDGDRLYFKDLGHQVGYRTVSLWSLYNIYSSATLVVWL